MESDDIRLSLVNIFGHSLKSGGNFVDRVAKDILIINRQSMCRSRGEKKKDEGQGNDHWGVSSRRRLVLGSR